MGQGNKRGLIKSKERGARKIDTEKKNYVRTAGWEEYATARKKVTEMAEKKMNKGL